MDTKMTSSCQDLDASLNFSSPATLNLSKINNKMGYVLVVCRSPWESSDNFENFLSSFDQVITDMSLSNPAFRLILEAFDCRSNSWWEGDISTKESIDMESVFSSHGLHQLLTDPTHILPRSFIDLIFIDQPSFANCHHQLTHCKLNLKIVFPTPMSA